MTTLASRSAARQAADAATALAAFVAVLHRRTGQDRVTVACRLGDALAGGVTVDLADDPTFGALVERVSAELDGLSPADDGEDASAAAGGTFELPAGDGDGPVWPLLAATDATEPREAAALAAAVRAGAASGAQDPRQPVSRLRLTTDADAPALHALGRSEREPLPARCIHDLVAEQAMRTPDAPAVSCGDEVLTYRQLDELADDLAGKLRAAGVRAGDVTAVLQPRSPTLVVTLLAILKAGGAYLALDPQYPPRHHAQLLADARAGLVVVDGSLRDRAPAGTPVADLADLLAADAPALAGPTEAHPDDLAYVSYTSGSTGEPRGVGVPHRAVSRLVRDPNWIDVAGDDVFLQLAPVAFDASTLEIWTPLVHGCRLAVAPAGGLELEQFAGTLQREAVTVLWLTAGLFHQLVTTHLDAFAGLRHVVAGGDVISPSHLARLLGAHPQLVFTNGYGPTENTTFTACWTTRAAPAAASVPIGSPVTGTHVAVLDGALRPVPPGVCGELYAAGEGLARGYVNAPAATADRFVPDTVSGVRGARMYRTGDLARWSADGTLDFRGRMDQQLKVQGFRVEPSQIEAELARLPEVRDAVVIAQPDDAGGKRLLAYVVPAEPDAADAADLGNRLRENLRAALPAYAVPWAILVRSELPLNANGKVDRRALPAATRVPRNVGNDFVAPRNRAEQRLAGLWGEVLGVEPVGIEDDFFDLGGHSLLVAELLATLNDQYGVDVPARVLYLQPTIAELAEELANGRPS